MRVGILGLGYWGPNLIRNFSGNSDVREVSGCDLKEARLKWINERFPSVKLSSDPNKFVTNPELDCVAIALPVGLHFEYAKKALESGKHIWVEKPFTATSAEAVELIELAEKKKLTIFVDHTFIYTGAVQKIKELVNNDVLGDILYFDSVRVNLGLF
ncbi:MAG: Gfo/Idh/MocA family oxidoreductase, partial [Melioribacteraceae bacterium]